MSVSRIVLAFAVTAFLGGASFDVAMAAGDEVVVAATPPAKLPTAAEVAKAKADADAKAASTAKPASTQDQVIARLASAPRIDRSGPAPADASGARVQPSGDKTGLSQIHGSAGVSIGTGGYRSAYVTSVIPVGETGLLGIAVSQTDYGKNGGYYGYGYDGYGYGGYGYDGYRHGYRDGYRMGQRGGTSQSFGLSLDMTGRGRANSDTPEGCAPGFRDGGRYIEPVWVTQMRDRDSDNECQAAVADKP
ncbi:hypothetical protein AEAC466_13345 [Asticcacaulis sp. AC466]|uniref:hypothetical protein n=1 Tax=Asticcacaulis sp. AC466 TaxID=1282362 RepID=UPI0003C401EC|nr:hypothetical protein [Asticcacaulis sp. AC466]ESQ83231.1 hypothetical protein AEAC466_13345 [Asticcacaulis sp. AC466]